MKTFCRKLLSLIIAFVLLLMILPISVFAVPVDGTDSVGDDDTITIEWSLGHVPPTLEGIITEDMLTKPAPVQIHKQDQDLPNQPRKAAFNSIESAGKAVRQSILNRDEYYEISFVSNRDPEEVWYDVFNEAVKHTGNPTEGDYILWQTFVWRSYNSNNDGTIRLYFAAEWFFDESENAKLEQAVQTILSSIKKTGMTEYEKAKACYDYLTIHVRYDYDALNDETYDNMLPYSAYGALVLNTCVCQGYSTALYRLLLECGVDNRVLTSPGHAWNLIKIGKYWYNADSTWDEGVDEEYYDFFLVTDEEVQKYDSGDGSHTRDPEYASSSFYASHPMGNADTLQESLQNPFIDVKTTNWFYPPVMWAYSTGVTTGATATTFEPNKTCTRAEFVAFLYKYMGMPWNEAWASECNFSDVKSNNWFYRAVIWANHVGVTHGTTSTTFSPNVTLDRAMVISFLYNMEKYQHGTPKVTLTSTKFTDVPKSAYYYDPVLWAEQYKITNGSTPTTFAPLDNCTRAEAVAFLYNIDKYWKG